MNQLELIHNRLKPELDKMNLVIHEALKCNMAPMDAITNRYLVGKGKQIRPIMVFLSAKIFGNLNDDTIYAAAALEMLHNASLIHDDVVDETKLRRAKPTINALWDNRIAVLVGDFFTSTALAVGLHTGNISVVAALSELGQELSLGEMQQIFNVRNRSYDYESYFSMIDKKTASLFRNCVKLGAETAGAKPSEMQDIIAFASLLGMCFQISDDIFDYFDSKEIGKPTGNDLREGKVTLPLLAALELAEHSEANKIKDILEADSLSDEQIAQIVDFAKNNGGIEYARHNMETMKEQADKLLDSYSQSQWTDSLREMFSFIINRKY